MKKSGERPKPMVYLGPGCPTLYYPVIGGQTDASKLPCIVVHKSCLQPRGWLQSTSSKVPPSGPAHAVSMSPTDGNQNDVLSDSNM